MDTSAAEITFDQEGVCSFCREYQVLSPVAWKRGAEGKKMLDETIQKIKKAGKNKEYDCLIGLSGGVDSSFVTYLAKEKWQLRPLVVHIDTGWNSELAVKNIENIVRKLDLDLYTQVIDWEEMKDVQLSFIKSGIICQDNPQDHVFVALLHKIAHENNVKYFLTGANMATECILPKSWIYNNLDSRLLRSIHKKFGSVRLKTFPLIHFWQYYFLYPFFRRLERVNPLNMMDYNKAEAVAILEKALDWRNYGGKHHESVFTKFYQAYYLPHRFGFEKRRAHLSSLVVTGQMTRAAALANMEKQEYAPQTLREDNAFVAKKLGISAEAFEYYLNIAPTTERDYPNDTFYFDMITRFKNLFSIRRL